MCRHGTFAWLARAWACVAALSCPVGSAYAAALARYSIEMRLHVPRIYDNSLSLGRRRYQTQRLVGEVCLKSDGTGEPEVVSMSLRNKTHRIGGASVTYDCRVDGVRWHMVGDNRTGVFKVASVKLDLDAEPSYALADGEDNALIVALAGRGNSKRIRGSVAGVIGCGCYAYGHVSPTRIMWTDTVVDTAGVYGTFKMRRSR